MSKTLTGQTIGKYKILERLGRGGMAEVYKGYQENLDRHVAIKLMHAFLVTEQDFLHRFQREAKAMAALNHPGIVGIYDFDVFGENSYYLVMEYIGGGTLKNLLEKIAKANKRLPLKEAIRITQEVAEALNYAHRRNMVHRDIKPGNIMLDEETGKAILTDFGIVKLLGGQSAAYTVTGALIGTPSYMSPEQALGKSGDERVDIYSLGILLFQMVTGQLPFEADTPLAVVMKHVNAPTPMPVSFNPDIPDSLQAIILQAMAKEPEDRYQTAAAFAADLQKVDLSGEPAAKQAAAPHTATEVLEAPAIDIPPTEPTTVLPPEPTAVVPSKPTPISPPERTEVLPPAPTQAALTAASAAAASAASVSSASTAVAPPKKRSPWLYVGAVALLALIVAGLVFGLSRRDGEETPTTVAVISESPTAVSTNTPEATAVPSPTPDVVATSLAAIELTKAANPTASPTATTAPTETATPTPDATLDFLTTCTTEVELINAYTYQSPGSSSAPIWAAFPMHWILKNSGTCPWPAGSHWTFSDGESFGASEPVTLENTVMVDEEITLTTHLTAPASAATYSSVWQLESEDGNPIGSPVSFSVTAYIPATATPIPPVATNTPIPSPTPEEIAELNYAFEIQSCEYVGSDWRCRVRLTPYGGGGGPYTMFIFLAPIVELRGQHQYDYYVQARRCAAWNTEIKVIDEATSLEMSRHLYVDPNIHMPGGCTE